MTLGDFLGLCSRNPSLIIFFYISVLLTTILASLFSRDEGQLSPWKYLYSFLVYAVAVPGIFAFTLTLYLLIFEGQHILDIDIYAQVLPILAMGIIIWLIKRNVDLENIPGFGRLSGLVAMITIVLVTLWILDKTRIFAITLFPFQWVVLLLVVVLVLARLSWARIFSD